jgi:ribonuclease HII
MLTIGVDEVGLGPIAGPVVVAAVVFPKRVPVTGLNDSKKLTDRRRRELAPHILEKALHWAIARSSSKQIDKFGIAVCKRACMTAVAQRCLERFPHATVIVDGVDPIPDVDCRCIIKADATVPAVSAASIIAKVYRDDYMLELAEKYPRYGFEKHMGYGTQYHRRKLVRHGACPEHRRSYEPVKSMEDR